MVEQRLREKEPGYKKEKAAEAKAEKAKVVGRGSHSSTFQLILSALYGIGGAVRTGVV
jgi:hypothetical protein